MVDMLECRDRERFEVFLYSHSVDDGRPLTQRIRSACEHYLDVTNLTNAAVAQRMREDCLDIAVDLKGHTRNSRFELLAARPARVQVAFLGYPASTGANFIDSRGRPGGDSVVPRRPLQRKVGPTAAQLSTE